LLSTPSTYPPIRGFNTDATLFQQIPPAPENEESKESLTSILKIPGATGNEEPLWLRSWTVQPTEYEKLVLSSMKEKSGKGEGKSKAKKAKGKAKK